jgi:hypothetical protein
MRIRSLILGIALALACAGAAQAADAIGQVKTTKGDVSVLRQGQAIPLKVGDHVYQSDTVTTAKGGSVGITFTDNSMMSLGSNSKLALTQYRFDATTHVGVFDSVLSHGTLAAKSGQIVKQTPEAMHISTPTALLGVRGTEFVVRVEGNS